MKRYLLLSIIAAVSLGALYYWYSVPKVVLSLPRCERDLALGYHAASDLGVLFDTGSSYSSMPQNVWQKCQELGYKMTFQDKKSTVRYIDDTQIHYDSECNIEFSFSSDFEPSIEFSIEPPSSYPHPYLMIGCSFLLISVA